MDARCATQRMSATIVGRTRRPFQRGRPIRRSPVTPCAGRIKKARQGCNSIVGHGGSKLLRDRTGEGPAHPRGDGDEHPPYDMLIQFFILLCAEAYIRAFGNQYRRICRIRLLPPKMVLSTAQGPKKKPRHPIPVGCAAKSAGDCGRSLCLTAVGSQRGVLRALPLPFCGATRRPASVLMRVLRPTRIVIGAAPLFDRL